MSVDENIRAIVREELAAMLPEAGHEPRLIDVAGFIEKYGISKSVVQELVRERETNGFPAVVLGPRTTRIDENRLPAWFAKGGLKLEVSA